MSRVLITGAASGLGLALARAFMARGDQVLATDRHAVDPVAPPEAGTLWTYRRLDVTRDEDWVATRAYVQDVWGGIDVVVNNAGIATGGRIDVADTREWLRVTDINLIGVARGCHYFTPMLKEQRSGHIVNTASLAGLVHGPGMSSYNAVKAGVVALSETLRYELAPWGITVSVVCPAFFATNLAASMQGADTELEKTAHRLINESGRSADDVAAVVIRGIDRGRFIILTDRVGHATFWAKRLVRPAYDLVLRRGGARMAYRELHPKPGHGSR